MISPRMSTVAVSGILACVAVFWWIRGWPLGVDTAVYRAGALAVVRGEELYDHLLALPSWAPELPFTYPPFAALVFTPFAALPVQLCWGLVAVAAAPALSLALRPFVRPGLVPVLMVGAFGLHPVWQSLGLGQLNLVLMAMVVADVLVLRDSRWSGVLIGLAAAVKLIPLIFIPHLLLTGRRADAARALATFAGATAAGFLLLPGDSARYWTSAIFNDHFAAMKGWAGNQSWQGFLARTVDSPVWTTALVLGVSAVFLALTALAVRRADPRVALLVTAACALLVSPISWTHHWVWIVPAIACLVNAARPVLAALAAVLFLGWPWVVVPNGGNQELSWTPVQLVVGNLYLIAAVAFLVAVSKPPEVLPGKLRQFLRGDGEVRVRTPHQ